MQRQMQRGWVLFLLLLCSMFVQAAEPIPVLMDEHRAKLDDRLYEKMTTTEELDVIVQYTERRTTHKRLQASTLANMLRERTVKRVELDQDVEVLGSWHVDRVLGAWNGTNGSGVRVAVLDTGVSFPVAGGWNVLTESMNYTDMHGHGSRVAGVLLDVAPGAEVYAVKVLDGGVGKLSDVLLGLEWAINNEMDIVVLSVGFASRSEIFKEVVAEAYAAGVFVVAASGNDGGAVVYPAAYADVVAVGATDEQDELASFSNHGFEQELVAPGVEINTTLGIVSGTSFAVSHVAGVAALVWSANRSLTNAEMRGKLQQDAVDLAPVGKDSTFGFGLVQAVVETKNTTVVNVSYAFDVYTVSGFGTATEAHVLWFSGVGTIDDIAFPEGYYVVTRYLPDPVNVTLLVAEDGGVEVLATGGDLLFFDGYAVDGTATDGAVWVNDDIVMQVDHGTLPAAFASRFHVEAECYSSDGDSGSSLETCWFSSALERTDCDAHSGLINCNSFTTCLIDVAGENRSGLVATSSTLFRDQRARLLNDCHVTSPSFWNTNNRQVLVMDQKRSVCVNGTHYRYEGRYNGGSWATYVGPISCDGLCTGGQTIIARNTPLTPPCLICEASGTIDVLVDVDGSGYADAPVLLNGVHVGATADFGALNGVVVRDVGCDVDQNVTVLCQDNVTVCGSVLTQMDVVGDVDSLQFDCSLQCGFGSDLLIRQADVVVDGLDVIVGVSSVGVTQSGVVVNVTRSTDENFFAESKLATVAVVAGQIVNGSVTFSSLEDGDVLRIWLDPADVVKAEDNANNFVERLAFKGVKVFLDVDLPASHSVLESVFEEYVSSFAEVVAFPSEADVLLHVREFRKPFFGEKLVVNGKELQKPNAVRITRRIALGNKPDVVVDGLGVEGMVAGLKLVGERRGLFLRRGVSELFLTDTDSFGVGVLDRLQGGEALQGWYQNNVETQQLVRGVLFDGGGVVAVRPVKTTDQTSYGEETVLRVKRVEGGFSAGYRDAFGVSSTPVVFSGGLFSDLETWEDDGKGLAAEMARDGFEVWEIEMTGGPGTECDDCPDYTYQDLVDYYWPASIAGITEYSGKNKVHYVGHSNGCRAALSSLHEYSNSGKNNAGFYLDDAGQFVSSDLPALPVDTFVGVACPGNLNNLTGYSEKARELIDGIPKGDIAIGNIRNKSLKHVFRQDYGRDLSMLGFLAGSDHRISTNLQDFYNDISINTTTIFDVSSVNVTASHLFAGENKTYPTFNEFGDDGVVPVSDVKSIHISLSGSNITILERNHGKLTEDKFVHNTIRGFLK